MIENAIKKLLGRGERKVVIPGIGVILKRDSGELIFSDMLRHDDGSLVSCVSELNNIPKEQAAALTAAYSDQIGKSLSDCGEAEINGIGKIRRFPNGTYRLEPAVAPLNATCPSDRTASIGAPAVSPEIPLTDYVPDTSTVSVSQTAIEPKTVSAPTQYESSQETPSATISTTAAAAIPTEKHAQQSESASAYTKNAPSETTAPKPNKAKLRAALYGDDPEDAEDEELHLNNAAKPYAQTAANSAAATRTTLTETVITEKITETVVAETPSATTQETDRNSPTINIRRPGRPRKKVDAVMITAIIALLIGLGVLMYGFITKQKLAGEENYIELSAEDPTLEQ